MLGQFIFYPWRPTFELEAYQSCILVPLEVGDLKEKIEESGEKVMCLKRNIERHKEMIVDLEKTKPRSKKKSYEVL